MPFWKKHFCQKVISILLQADKTILVFRHLRKTMPGLSGKVESCRVGGFKKFRPRSNGWKVTGCSCRQLPVRNQSFQGRYESFFRYQYLPGGYLWGISWTGTNPWGKSCTGQPPDCSTFIKVCCFWSSAALAPVHMRILLRSGAAHPSVKWRVGWPIPLCLKKLYQPVRLPKERC